MKTFGQLKAEIQTAARVRGVKPEEIMETLIEWMDYTYHGVVPLPFMETDAASAVLPDTSQPEGRGLEE